MKQNICSKHLKKEAGENGKEAYRKRRLISG
jgi:hypothetical protein